MSILVSKLPIVRGDSKAAGMMRVTARRLPCQLSFHTSVSCKLDLAGQHSLSSNDLSFQYTDAFLCHKSVAVTSCSVTNMTFSRAH